MPTVPKLAVSRKQASRLLQKRIDLGVELSERRPTSYSGLELVRESVLEWSERNAQVLNEIVTTRAFEREYRDALGPTRWRIGQKALADERQRLRDEISEHIGMLQLLQDRIGVMEEAAVSGDARKLPVNLKRVFIVHGHDHAALHNVQNVLLKLDLEPVVLSDQTSGGKTVIEKFEAESSTVGYAVVLLTPDDHAGSASDGGASRRRARQNVIFELGYFVAKLGRSRVCLLYRPEVEMPSDFHGVVYVVMDDHGGWKTQFVKEMRAAGLPVDLNRL